MDPFKDESRDVMLPPYKISNYTMEQLDKIAAEKGLKRAQACRVLMSMGINAHNEGKKE